MELVGAMDVVSVVFKKASTCISAGDERDRWRNNGLSLSFHVMLMSRSV